MWKRILLYAVVLVPGVAIAQSVGENDLRKALQCMQPDTTWERKFLHLHGNSVSYRIYEGGVPETSDEQVPFQLLTLVFYSPNEKRAIVATGAPTADKKFLMYSDQYRAIRIRGIWQATSGQGSVGTYERVSKFVGDITKQPPRTLSMHPTDKSVCVSESQWNVGGSEYLKQVRPSSTAQDRDNH